MTINKTRTEHDGALAEVQETSSKQLQDRYALSNSGISVLVDVISTAFLCVLRYEKKWNFNHGPRPKD